MGADEPLEAYYNEVLPTYPFIFGGVVMLGEKKNRINATLKLHKCASMRTESMSRADVCE